MSTKGNPYNIVIVGNGILSSMLGKDLATHGHKVTIIGPSKRNGSASLASGAMLGHFGEVTKDTFSSEYSQAKFNLSHRASTMWPLILDELREIAQEHSKLLHIVSGTFIILNGKGSTLDTINYEAIENSLLKTNSEYTTVDPTKITGYNPPPGGRSFKALYIPSEGALNSHQLLNLLDLILIKKGVTIIDNTVSSIQIQENRASGVILSSGEELTADKIVVASGVGTAELVNATGIIKIQPILSGVGNAINLNRTRSEGFRNVVRTPNRGGACGLHAIPLGNGREYVGASNVLSCSATVSPSAGATNIILEQFFNQLDEKATTHEIIEIRTGNRPVPLDGFPLLGKTSLSDLYIMTGTYRDGLQASPAIAEAIRKTIEGKQVSPSLSIFYPERNPIQTRSITESVEEAAMHMTSLFIEMGGKVSNQMETKMIYDQNRRHAESIYNTLGDNISFTPDVLCFLMTCSNFHEMIPIIRFLAKAKHNTLPN